MPKVIDLSLEDAYSIVEILEYSGDSAPTVSFPTGYTTLKFVSKGSVENFLWYSISTIFNIKHIVDRVLYNFKCDVAMKTETNCINYGGYMFNGIMYSYLGTLVCIGMMTVRVAAVNVCNFGAWVFDYATNTWTNIQELGNYTTSDFASDAVLTIKLAYKYNVVAERYSLVADVAVNGTDKISDINIVNAGVPSAFDECKWRVGSVLRMLDTSVGDYYATNIKKVVYN